MAKNPIKVSLVEWEDAEAFFKANPHEIKFRKGKKLARSHSFFQFDGVVYVVNNTKHIDCEADAGGGGNSRVKRAFNKQGECFVIKVEDFEFQKVSEIAELLLKELGQKLSDRTERTVNKKMGESGRLIVGGEKKIIRYVHKKYYTLHKYLGNRDLFEELVVQPRLNNKPVSQDEILTVMLKAMMSTYYLHQKNIAHLDVKLENFVVNGHGANRVVTLIDFEFADEMPSNENPIHNFKIKKEKLGTPDYLSPEIKKNGQYSLESDIFAFGYLLWGLEVDYYKFCKDLLSADRSKRPTLMQAMLKIALHLESVKNNPENYFLKEEMESAIQSFRPLVPQTLPTELYRDALPQTYLPYEEMAALRIHVPSEPTEEKHNPLPTAPLLSIQKVKKPVPTPLRVDAKCVPCRCM